MAGGTDGLVLDSEEEEEEEEEREEEEEVVNGGYVLKEQETEREAPDARDKHQEAAPRAAQLQPERSTSSESGGGGASRGRVQRLISLSLF